MSRLATKSACIVRLVNNVSLSYQKATKQSSSFASYLKISAAGWMEVLAVRSLCCGLSRSRSPQFGSSPTACGSRSYSQFPFWFLLIPCYPSLATPTVRLGVECNRKQEQEERGWVTSLSVLCANNNPVRARRCCCGTKKLLTNQDESERRLDLAMLLEARQLTDKSYSIGIHILKSMFNTPIVHKSITFQKTI